MKQSFHPLMLFAVINEACGGGGANAPKNIGGKTQCLEAPVKSYALAREGFAFPDMATAKNKAAWDTAIENKDIIPFPFVEGIEANNTEATIRNGRYKDFTLKEAVRGSTYRQDLAICTHEAVKSYENSEYSRIFRLTSNNEITCDILEDGRVKGEALSSFIVGIRQEATDADNPFTNVAMKFKKDIFSILKGNFEVHDLEGVYELSLLQVSATATSIKFKAIDGCSGTLVTGLAAGDLVVRNAAGAVQTTSFVAPDANGVYTLTGTGFQTGYTVEVSGVITQAELMYEGTQPLVITVA